MTPIYIKYQNMGSLSIETGDNSPETGDNSDLCRVFGVGGGGRVGWTPAHHVGALEPKNRPTAVQWGGNAMVNRGANRQPRLYHNRLPRQSFRFDQYPTNHIAGYLRSRKISKHSNVLGF